MAKDTAATDGTKKTRAKRSAKPKRYYLLFDGVIEDAVLKSMRFARNGDEALDAQADAKANGVALSFTRVTLPVVKKAEATA